MNYRQSLDYIYSYKTGIYKRSDEILLNTQLILDKLGYRQTFKVIHIAGTKGKGSTTLVLSKMLESAKNKVGSFISPHILDERERVSINGEWISEERFADIISKIKNILEKEKLNTTVFEFFTILCLYYFYEENIDYACIEVGIGGRIDCTNIVSPSISIITNISYDHTDILGDDIKDIAYEKAGIIKKNIPVVLSRQTKEVIEVIENKAKETNSDIFILGRDFNTEIIENNMHSLKFKYLEDDYKEDFVISLLGSHQSENVSIAFKAFRTLYKNESNSFYKKAIEDLQMLTIKARLTIASNDPIIIIDGAHNGHSLDCILFNVFSWFSDIIVLFAPLVDKDINRMAKVLLKYKDKMSLVISATKNIAKNTDSLYVHQYIESININSKHIKDFDEALLFVKKQAISENKPILIVGSLYSASDYFANENIKK